MYSIHGVSGKSLFSFVRTYLVARHAVRFAHTQCRLRGAAVVVHNLAVPVVVTACE